MTYQVLARKWRPQKFADLAGQEHVAQTLINALNLNRLHHAYLFTGTRGVGKTTIARILAKCFNCEKGITATPCGQCKTCLDIESGRFIDLIEVDAASRTKVEDTRELLDNVQYTPTQGRYKIYLIDEVHMLSNHSFNALLKTLEEPPPHIIFLLATTDPQKLPVTILSRCLQFQLKNLALEKIIARAQHILNTEKIEFEIEALSYLAKAANGSMRDALSLLDQAIAYGNGQIKTVTVKAMLGTIEQSHLFDIANALINKNPAKLLDISTHLAEHAADFNQVLEELISFFHQLSVLQIVPDFTTEAWENLSQLKELAKQFTAQEIQLYYQITLIGRRDLPLAPTAKSGFEMVLLRLAAFHPEKEEIVTTKTISANSNKPNTPTNSVNKIASQNSPAPKQDINHSKIPPKNISSNWAEIITNLNVSGVGQALLNHCALVNLDEHSIELALDPSQAPLLNKRIEERLNIAFNEYFQKTLKLIITIGEKNAETPAIQNQKAQQQRLEVASKSIHNDSGVQKILETFNGRIVTDSIKPKE